MQVGARVMVKDGAEFYGGRYGYAVENHDLLEEGFKVMLDGDRRAIPFAASELLPVEVAVLRGPCGVTLKTETMHYLEERTGDVVRITIERVKKEAPPDETP